MDKIVIESLEAKVEKGKYDGVFDMLNRNPMLVVATVREITGLRPEKDKRELHETLGRVLVGHTQQGDEEPIAVVASEANSDSE